jgi:hypothetical protein
LLLLLCSAAQAHTYARGELEARHPWSRETVPGATAGVAYMEIRNRGAQPDRLVGATTPLAARVELHVIVRKGEVTGMRHIGSLEIPPRARIELRPGGSHLMLIDLARPLKKGERVPLTLRFERAGELQIELEVQQVGSRHPRH